MIIKGSIVNLRPWNEADLPTITALRNDVVLQAKLLAIARGSKESEVRDWLEKRSSGTDKLFFVIAEPSSDDAIGYLQFLDIDPVNLHADMGICLSPASQSKGAGTEALKLVLAELADKTKLRKVNLRVRVDNPAAIRCYRGVGFLQSGLLVEHVFIEGTWQDIVLMEYFLLRKN